jgi:predicted regulator of Ras-like GTPase activity (Roadblock/LC7/MglB family)
MEPATALSELVGLSTQVVEAVVTGPDGTVDAARAADDERARALASAGAAFLAEAAALRPTAPAVERVHVDLERGSLVAVSDGGRTIVATTVPEPTAGLVAFDLRTALRRLAEDAS